MCIDNFFGEFQYYLLRISRVFVFQRISASNILEFTYTICFKGVKCSETDDKIYQSIDIYNIIHSYQFNEHNT